MIGSETFFTIPKGTLAKIWKDANFDELNVVDIHTTKDIEVYIEDIVKDASSEHSLTIQKKSDTGEIWFLHIENLKMITS
jgi:predicted RNA binding protein YcfA (HicA-like mRNA interferase family)